MKTVLTAKQDPNNGKFILVEYAPTPATSKRIGIILSDGSFVPDGPIIHYELMVQITDICDRFWLFYSNIKTD